MLCFLHIAKTAGTAFRQALTEMVSKEEIYWIGSPAHPVDQWRHISASDLARYKVVGGHTGYHNLRAKCPDATFATLLRDPVHRAVSLFRFITSPSGGRNAALQRQLQSHDLLSAIHCVPEFKQRISDAQCRAIAGTRSFQETERAIDRGDWMIETTAHIDRLLRRISQRYGWPQVTSKPFNVADEAYFQKLCTDEVAETIRDLNQEDVQLVDKYGYRASSTGSPSSETV